MLQFVREIPIRMVIQGALSSRRGFLFHLAAGFSHDIDPLSGMSINLVKVDEWLWKLKKNLEKDVFISETESLNHSFAEIMAVTRLSLLEEVEKEKAELTSLHFREERGWSFAWNSAMSPQEMIFQNSHYIESLPREGHFDLLRVHLEWRRQPHCEADYAHESFLLLKSLTHTTAEDLHKKAAALVGHQLESGTSLQRVHLDHLGESYKVSFP